MGAAALALLAAGCTHTVSVGHDRTVQVALTEYRLRPDSIRAPAGRLTIVVHNDGRLVHDLTVDSGAEVLGSTTPIPPGGTQTVTVTLGRGSYSLFSQIQADDALGLHGSLTITTH
jgi:hypothetical protein